MSEMYEIKKMLELLIKQNYQTTGNCPKKGEKAYWKGCYVPSCDICGKYYIKSGTEKRGIKVDCGGVWTEEFNVGYHP
jgi:hypothetical protein